MSKVPEVKVIDAEVLKASESDHVAVEIPLLPKVTPDVIAFPLEVTVYVPVFAEKDKVPLCVHVIPEAIVRFPPLMKTPEVPANVPVKPVKLRLRQFAKAVTVTVTAPDPASK